MCMYEMDKSETFTFFCWYFALHVFTLFISNVLCNYCCTDEAVRWTAFSGTRTAVVWTAWKWKNNAGMSPWWWRILYSISWTDTVKNTSSTIQLCQMPSTELENIYSIPLIFYLMQIMQIGFVFFEK